MINLNDPKYYEATHSVIDKDTLSREIKRLIIAQERVFCALLAYHGKLNLPAEHNWWEVERFSLSQQKTLTDIFFRVQYFYQKGDLNYPMLECEALPLCDQVIPVTEGERQAKRSHLYKWVLGGVFNHNPYLVTSLLIDYPLFLQNIGSLIISRCSSSLLLDTKDAVDKPQLQNQALM
jgi:hypothetical protein